MAEKINTPIVYNFIDIHFEVTGKIKYRTDEYGNLMRGKVYAEVEQDERGEWTAMVWDDDDRQNRARWAFGFASKGAATRWANKILRDEKEIGVDWIW